MLSVHVVPATDRSAGFPSNPRFTQVAGGEAMRWPIRVPHPGAPGWATRPAFPSSWAASELFVIMLVNTSGHAVGISLTNRSQVQHDVLELRLCQPGKLDTLGMRSVALRVLLKMSNRRCSDVGPDIAGAVAPVARRTGEHTSSRCFSRSGEQSLAARDRRLYVDFGLPCRAIIMITVLLDAAEGGNDRDAH